MYGEEVTPNHHKLAREFTLFDNFYCSGVLSADGHQWVNEAYVTDYLEKAFGGFTRSYPYEGAIRWPSRRAGSSGTTRWPTRSRSATSASSSRRLVPKGTTWTDMYEEYKSGAGKVKCRGQGERRGRSNHTRTRPTRGS